MDSFLRRELLKRSYTPHASSMLQYNRCRRKWALHQLYEPPEEHKALTFGTVFHQLLELALPDGLYTPDLVRAAQQSLGVQLEDEDFALMQSMLDYFFSYWMLAPENEWFQKLEFLEVEKEFEIDQLAGRLDAVVRDEFGRLWVIDYKTRTQLSREGTFDTDLQMTAYTWAASRLYPDEEVEGVIVLQFLKKPAKGLRKLQSGKYSTAKNQKVSPLIVRRQLEELPEDERDAYLDFVFYDPDEDPYIRAVKTYRNRTNLERFEKYLVLHKIEVGLLIERYVWFTPSFTRDCLWDCPFRAVCMAYEDGYDWQEILEGNFKQREVK